MGASLYTVTCSASGLAGVNAAFKSSKKNVVHHAGLGSASGTHDTICLTVFISLKYLT
jgi:hypothetical protein